MSRYILIDTRGREQRIEEVISIDTLRALLSEFKTHCAVENSAYEFNHFCNWATKYHGFKFKYWNVDEPQRVDM